MAANYTLGRKRALSALCLGLLLEEEEERPRKRNRQVYMRNWISRREERGVFHQLVKELEVGDAVAYKDFFRMTKNQFALLVEKVSPLIQKKDQPQAVSPVRATIQPDERLAVTLRFLATGETFHSLEYSFRISRQTISSIVSETSRALYKVGRPNFVLFLGSSMITGRLSYIFGCFYMYIFVYIMIAFFNHFTVRKKH